MQKYQKDWKNPRKRRVVSLDECKLELKEALPLMFTAFKEALKSYNRDVVLTRPEARARGFEASLLNSKMIESVQNFFPNKWKFAKYKRFVLNVKGFVILFKKLNNKNLPMNIKTKSVNAISNQLSLPLFNDVGTTENPILFFGYKKDILGNISEPKLVYIDEDKVKWTITQDDIDDLGQLGVIKPINTSPSLPVLKENVRIKKKNIN
ncbi:hypothetical protein ACFSQJ_03160 [Croceitalea marina]|uniref:Uncharacterized protein n=1 Tax=Croceitalea marina TaxID=1775166 RepID=A0ABW5MT84_9FLAO